MVQVYLLYSGGEAHLVHVKDSSLVGRLEVEKAKILKLTSLYKSGIKPWACILRLADASHW